MFLPSQSCRPVRDAHQRRGGDARRRRRSLLQHQPTAIAWQGYRGPRMCARRPERDDASLLDEMRRGEMVPSSCPDRRSRPSRPRARQRPSRRRCATRPDHDVGERITS
jgi:hypothetical protein